ncbi:helix-turn-helix transcriptional regulator [Nitrobacter sp. TKz-YC01]|uniref:helix-turn-helix transcriptional regulator n=1 Tax=Nitrobacter sp. TKz-YC01 TaxID=3398703 RepID=UPI003A1029C9
MARTRRRQRQPALVVHVLPLFRSARDMMFGAEILVAATTLNPSSFVPSPTILMGLFDLTPAEVRLVTSLGRGLSLKAVAQENGIKFSTARSYLDKIFRRTGTNHQGQLVALLKATQPLQV